MRRAKIICTLGPSCSSEEKIEELILAGMNVARLNFSHGDHSFHQGLINRIRAVAGRLGMPIGVLQDLQGPKLRIGKMENNGVLLAPGQQITITTRSMLGNASCFSSQYPAIAKDVQSGDTILLDDGKIFLTCLSVLDDENILCEVAHGGLLMSNKGIHLPDRSISAESITPKDIQDLHFGASIGVDAVALSFVRSVQDINQLRAELAASKSRPLIIAKIEKREAVQNIEEIMDACDGVMIARGDLGVEIPLEQVPTTQKIIVDMAIKRGKVAIVATQMLESMINEPRPTRAEASDVANAVLDGADMLMLSAETASGAFPVETVKTMVRIIEFVEAGDLAGYWRTKVRLSTSHELQVQNAVSLAAVRACQELAADVIAVYTTSGATARLVSDYRPRTPILAFVPSLKEQRQLCFVWGVRAIILSKPASTEGLWQSINDHILNHDRFREDQTVVLITKMPFESNQKTNTLHIHNLKRSARGATRPLVLL